MPIVDLKTEQWNQVINILANAPWRDANPLLVEISQQLQAQQRTAVSTPDSASKGDGHVESVLP